MDFSYDKIYVFLTKLKQNIIKNKREIEGFVYKPCGYKKGNVLPQVDETWTMLEAAQLWGGEKDAHFWFYKHFRTENETVFRLNTGLYGEGWGAGNPQFLVYLNGKMVYGMDYFHETIELDKNTDYDMYIYAYTNDAVKPLEFVGYVEEIDETVKKLYYDISVPLGVCAYLEETDKTYIDIINYLKTAVNIIDMRVVPSSEFSCSVKKASEYLERAFYDGFCGGSSCNVIGIGHSHIDVAWLWTVMQTREKVQRTFSSVVSMMKKYPEFKFMASTPQLYEFVRQEAPKLYDEIKELVRQGRWEFEGAMWVEADCNLPNGESLVRQILFGKRFFWQEFNKDCKILWLPDVFGYSAALPQIMKKSGIDIFVTSKINWNEANQMPHDTFMWQGIDGTEILAYLLTSQDKKRGKKPERYTTYTGLVTPSMVAGTWERYQDKSLNDEALLTYGYGDGGGGPAEWMIENGRRLQRGIKGSPGFRFNTVTSFFRKLEQSVAAAKTVPKWVGELYLEFHRGTYTSIAKNKRYNRKCEFLYHNAELLSMINTVLAGKKYPQEEINNGWKGILLNQFHDIIPGSSIKEVYDESDKLYDEILQRGEIVLNDARDFLIDNIKTNGGVLVFNSTPFSISGPVMVRGKIVHAEDIPANGFKVVQPIVDEGKIIISENRIENEFFVVDFVNGNISRIYDKMNSREIIKPGEYANTLIAFEDFPRDWDAWEISSYYEEKSWLINDVESIEKVDYGEKAGYKITRRFLNSNIVQEICLLGHTPRIDFDTYINWQEKHILLKAAFPIDVHTEKATYDIQFGNVERPTHRNTSWDEAKFEVCAHKFADVSENGYGVSLLNDCKYGYDVCGSTIRLTLLKSAAYPNFEADNGEHKFTYSLYPHKGGFVDADVVKQAYLLNNPFYAVSVKAKAGKFNDFYSFVNTDCDNVVAETVKKAEDDSGVVVRLYESANKRQKVKINFGFEIKRAALCNLMETETEELCVRDNSVICKLKPFEIITLKVESK